jgi:hypothetical protein
LWNAHATAPAGGLLSLATPSGSIALENQWACFEALWEKIKMQAMMNTKRTADAA